MKIFTQYKNITPYVTKDGSLIRELMHPATHGNRNQSFAEASIPLGVTTYLHRHRLSEEIYYITNGSGVMTLGEQRFNLETAVERRVECAPLGAGRGARRRNSELFRRVATKLCAQRGVLRAS